ncbi:hypothetical protein M422DRAFT_36535 [Sphaerobolus stellatus SS14]|uniref:Uncharacterized protein n=1 Tax=Sphaerobolus stellatus (strain SS14) TaxID=990650 RepID=A0A0C9UNS8_SPHS4|nr:hypothetical protein M422DRAFT_36535 [Sphaerobolus stellatus SS14]
MHPPSDTDIFSPNGPTIDGKQFANSLTRKADHFSPQKVIDLKRRRTLPTRNSTSPTLVGTCRTSLNSIKMQSTGNSSTQAIDTQLVHPTPGTPNPDQGETEPNHIAQGAGTGMGIAPHYKSTASATYSQQGLAPGTCTPASDDSPPANINHTVLGQALARPLDGFPMAALTVSEIQERNTPQCQTTWSVLEGRKVLAFYAYCKINLDPTVMQAPIQTKISALLSHPVRTHLGVPSDHFQGGYHRFCVLAYSLTKAEHNFLVHQGCFAFPDITFFCYSYNAPPPSYAITLQHLPLGFTDEEVRDLLHPHYLEKGSRNFYHWMATHRDNIPPDVATNGAEITSFVINSLMVQRHDITIEDRIEEVFKIFMHPPSAIHHTAWLNHLRTFGYKTGWSRHLVYKDVLCILCKARDHKVVDCPFRNIPGFPIVHPNAPDNLNDDGHNEQGAHPYGGNSRGRGRFSKATRGRRMSRFSSTY